MKKFLALAGASLMGVAAFAEGTVGSSETDFALSFVPWGMSILFFLTF